jgi:hypothetical protein
VLTSYHIVVDSVIIVGSSIVLSLLILWAVRKVFSHEQLTPHNEVSGFVYAAIGVIYAVILGFAIISVWEEHRDAEANAVAEASALGNLYRIAEGLPDPFGDEIQQTVLDYAATVVDEEWQAMEEGTAPSEEAVRYTDQLWRVFYDVELSTPAEEGLYSAALEEMDSVSHHRRERLQDADSGLLGIIWGVMIGGAVLTVLFPCLFGVENGLVHSMIIGTLAAALGLLLLLAYDLNHPFQGDVRIQPDVFVRVIDQFRAPGSVQSFVPRP